MGALYHNPVMAHPVETFEDLVDLLERKPELRPRLLRVLLTDEFLRLPERFDRLEKAVTRLTHQVHLLAESHRELQQEVRALAESHKALVKSHLTLQKNVSLLQENVSLLQENVSQLTEAQVAQSDVSKKMLHLIESMAESQHEMRQDMKRLSDRA